MEIRKVIAAPGHALPSKQFLGRPIVPLSHLVSAGRGLVVIGSPIGVVACNPVGMGMVSSVITADEGKTLHKVEDLGYFQFGGSDLVMVLERGSEIQLSCELNVHYNRALGSGPPACGAVSPRGSDGSGCEY